jgi:hypothetical protein
MPQNPMNMKVVGDTATYVWKIGHLSKPGNFIRTKMTAVKEHKLVNIPVVSGYIMSDNIVFL